MAAVRGWVTSLERYLADFETELLLIVGGSAGTAMQLELAAPARYRSFIAGMLMATSIRPADEAVQVRLFELGNEKAEAATRLRELMGKLKLTVNEDKTRICKVPEGEVDFLGYTRSGGCNCRRPAKPRGGIYLL